jgi:cellulase/cellobiase CelA1
MSANRPRALLAALIAAAVLAFLTLVAGPAAAAPGPPGDLRVTAITPTSVTLSWTPAAGDVASYLVTNWPAFNDTGSAQPVGDVTTAIITSGIRPTTQYTFRVYARDAAGADSPSSAPVTVVTPAGTAGDTVPPSTPAGLRVTGSTPAGPALAWSPATDNVAVTGYDVYFFDGWFTSTKVGSTAGTSFTAPPMSGVSSSQGYYVRARDAAGNVSIATGTVSAPPTGPTTPPTTSPPPPARTCRVEYRTTSQWAGGFVAQVTVTNTGAAPVVGWTLTFPFGGDQRVTSAWNATVAQSGADVTLTGVRWNRTIVPGGSVTAGLLGRWSAGDAAPVSAALNGAACDVG